MRLPTRLLLLFACVAATSCGSSAESTAPVTPGTPTTPSTPTPDPRLGTSQLNVVYCTAGGVPLRLDVYYPTVAPPAGGRWPLIVYDHGGELIEGDKGKFPGSPVEAWVNALAPRGYVFASVNYRLGPAFKFPAMIEDAKCAIRYFRANATTYNIDPARIGATGTSSGAYLATLIGVTDATAGYEGTGGWPGVSSRVAAVVSEYGVSDVEAPPFSQLEADGRLLAYPPSPSADFLRNATAKNHVTADDPPFYLLHGDHDPFVNPQVSRDLYAKFQAIGVPSQLTMVVNAGHGWPPGAGTQFGLVNPTWQQILVSEMAIFDKYLKP